MPRLTAIRELPRDRVALELDGQPWRVVPTNAVARAGLVPGMELDRERVRGFRRALRDAVAVDVAMRSLSRRDASRAELEGRLARRGIATPVQTETLDRLSDLGLVDDRRFAEGRARQLAERGYGDDAIRHDLEHRGIDTGVVDAAVGVLADEASRAAALLERDGLSARTLTRLARRGFSASVLDDAAAQLPDGPAD